MRLFLFSLTILFLNNAFSQNEEVGALKSNPHIEKIKSIEKKVNSFDGTFIYIIDTLNLPIFDDFSKNKFQKYTANYTDSDVTASKKFKLIDNNSLNPLDKNKVFSSQKTYRKIYSNDNLSHTETQLPTISIKIGDLSKYPVNYSTTSVYPAYNIYDSLGITNDIPDTILIQDPDIKQDSATQFFKTINNQNSIWIDDFAYHNYRFGYKPWSIGVATFDGLDQYGKAYELSTTITNYGDYLTSKPIDLSTNNAADSIYLSFLYQSGGYGETPDETDSLILEFYDKTLDKWNWIWSTNGETNLDFKVGHIDIKKSRYLKKGFKFRFKNYGQLSGGFDHFNIDYVHLRTLSGYQDTLFKDFAWSSSIESLIKDYTSVPWDHYKNQTTGKMNDKVTLSIRNGSNLAENNSIPAKIEIKYNTISEGEFNLTGNSLSAGDLNYSPRTNYTTTHDFTNSYNFDQSKPGTKQSFDIIGTIGAQFPNLAQNDSTFSKQYFGNYYSYDDGSAEAAYGLIGVQSNLAIKFIPYESDSIIGINTNFVESATDVSNKLFLLTVWDDENGRPGKLLYEDEVFSPRNPIYNYGIDNYYTYYFPNNKKVKVDGAFYIGWRQFSNERLNIGFDKNTVNSNIFYSLNKGATWVKSSVEGSVMMRPLFSTSMDAELGLIELDTQEFDFNIYPNPFQNTLNITTNINDYQGVDIYNILGKLIISTQDKQIDLSDESNGVYLLKTKGSINKTYKIIKN